jgi:hypothetical protein
LSDIFTGYGYFLAREYYSDRAGSACNGMGYPPRGSTYNLCYSICTVGTNLGSRCVVDADCPTTTPGINAPCSAGFACPPDDTVIDRIDAFDYGLAYAWGFRLTNDPQFLYEGRRTVASNGTYDGNLCADGGIDQTGVQRRAAYTLGTLTQGYAVYSGWPAREFIYTDLHRSEFGTTFLNDESAGHPYTGLGKVDHLDGSYTLTWTVPPSAQRYQLKYGPHPMVPNLNYDKYSRTFQYPPAAYPTPVGTPAGNVLYDNFWANNGEGVTNAPVNLRNEPTPQAEGTTQTWTVSGLPAGQYFALRADSSVQIVQPIVLTPTPGASTPTAARTPTPTKTPTIAPTRALPSPPILIH